ncbi:hypothetical protein AB0B88_12150 [Micromonospora haikouensis]|uniref:hypothetical protein n=1 Tax=Micromonospora haikouensis TaxID=686309 RepID=UPI0033DB13E9
MSVPSRRRLSSAITWLLACVGMVASAIFPFFVVVGRSTIWTFLLGWPLGYLLAWLVARRRGLSAHTRRRVLGWGFLAIFVVMFVDEGESGRTVSGKATGRPPVGGGRTGESR